MYIIKLLDGVYNKQPENKFTNFTLHYYECTIEIAKCNIL